MTKTQEEWPFIRTVGEAEQTRIPIERDEKKGMISHRTKKHFVRKGRGENRNPKREMGEIVISRSQG